MKNKRSKITNLLKVGILLFGFSLLLWNCENENLAINNEQNSNIKEQFTLDNFKNSFVKNNLKINWDDYIIVNEEQNNAITYEFNTSLVGKNESLNKGQDYFYKYKLLAKYNTGDNVSFEVLKFISNSQKEIKNVSILNISDFTGTLHYYNLLGETSKIEAYKKGKLISEVNNKLQIHNNYASKTPYMGRYVLVVTDYYVDWYKGGGDGNFVYMLSVYESTSVEYVYIEEEYSGGEGGDTTPVLHSHYDEPHGPSMGLDNHPEEIIDNTRNPCVSAIIKALQEKDTYGALVPDLKGKTHLSQMVLDLFGECTNHDLVIDIAQLGTNSQGFPLNAQTNGIESITLDTDLVKEATQLSIAKTLIHESLHAYINLYLDKYDRSKTFEQSIKIYYTKYKNDPNLSQHNFMSQFVEALAYSLSAYDNHQQDMSYYTALSWGGLESSDAYKALSSTEKTAIQKIINNERYAKSDAKSTKC
ncbi:hypothetical protein [Tenacibaculum sp.]|uniref:hypothetical protein n=1 Tax=Tenacibaculum sp. TaxID=1906242 RepID=UPI003D0F4F2A